MAQRHKLELADEIVRTAALVSQFRPDTLPTPQTFSDAERGHQWAKPVDGRCGASKTSGARMQGRLAAEHQKRVHLLESLVETFDWAKRFAQTYRDSTRVISDSSDVSKSYSASARSAKAAQGSLSPIPEVEEARRPEP